MFSRPLPRVIAALAFLAVALVGARTGAARDWPDDDLTVQQLEAFDRYLDGHPDVAAELRRDPRLGISRRYLEEHSGLRRFLEDHPGIRQEFEDDPYDAMAEVERYRWREVHAFPHPLSEADIRAFDRFLDDHPAVRHDLRGDPWLAHSPRYLRNHDSFADFLDDHPDIRVALEENPQQLLNEVEHHDRGDDGHRGRRGKHH